MVVAPPGGTAGHRGLGSQGAVSGEQERSAPGRDRRRGGEKAGVPQKGPAACGPALRKVRRARHEAAPSRADALTAQVLGPGKAARRSPTAPAATQGECPPGRGCPVAQPRRPGLPLTTFLSSPSRGQTLEMGWAAVPRCALVPVASDILGYGSVFVSF